MIHVTAHAISRYRERVEPVSADTARERIAQAVQRFGEIAARCEIILGTGQKLVVDNMIVVTVRPKARSKRRKLREFEEW